MPTRCGCDNIHFVTKAAVMACTRAETVLSAKSKCSPTHRSLCWQIAERADLMGWPGPRTAQQGARLSCAAMARERNWPAKPACGCVRGKEFVSEPRAAGVG